MKTLKDIVLDLYVTVLIKHKHIVEPPKEKEYSKRYEVQSLLLKAIENAKHLDQLEFCRNYLERYEIKLGHDAAYPRFMLQVKIQELSNMDIVEIKDNNFDITNNKVIITPAWCGPYIN